MSRLIPPALRAALGALLTVATMLPAAATGPVQTSENAGYSPPAAAVPLKAFFTRTPEVALPWGHRAAPSCDGPAVKGCLNVSNSTILKVDSVEALNAALAKASGGETFLLAPGDYGRLNLTGKAATNLTFKAESPGSASFSGGMLRGVQGVTFEDVTFDYTFQAGDTLKTEMLSVRNSSDIIFRRVLLTGDMASGTGKANFDDHFTGFGLRARDSQNIVIEDSEVTGFWKGIYLARVDGAQLLRTELHEIRSDALNLIDTRDVLVEDNQFHSIRRSMQSGDHADMIQVWSGQDDPARKPGNMVIRNNYFDIADGDRSQMIYMDNSRASNRDADPAIFYSNILIENNVIISGTVSGIKLGAVDAAVIRNNILVYSEAPDADTAKGAGDPRIRVAPHSTNVVISDNITYDVKGYSGQADWSVSGNVKAQSARPGAPGYVGGILSPISHDPAEGTPVDATLLAFDSGTGLLSMLEDGTMQALLLPAAALTPMGGGGTGLDLGTAVVETPASAVAPLGGGTGFRLDAGLRLETGQDRGVVFLLKGVLMVSVTDQGGLEAVLTTATGDSARVQTPGPLGDGGWHDVSLTYDGAAGGGGLTLTLDGVLQDTVALEGALPEMPRKGLMLGSPWHADAQGGLRHLSLTGLVEHSDPILSPAPVPPVFPPEIDSATLLAQAVMAEGFDFLEDPALAANLMGDARLTGTEGDGQLSLGTGGALHLPGLPGDLHSQHLAAEILFQVDLDVTERSTLLSSHRRFEAELVGDRLKLTASTAEGGTASVTSGRLTDLQADGPHRLTLELDARADLLTAHLDGQLVLAETGIDFDLAASTARERGWHMGNRWSDAAQAVEIDQLILADLDALPPETGDLLLG
ncbi:right-handed parallel beta-helix repeat-containing protein [Meridianimarinicoccus sp. MJW13]|uniref:right-handed parallel beta-helix repeat-containing protein n=2 Tax=unclassified Meridianimarinicoccus TaxID=2923344 RepID=UPI0018694A37|nr:right-handed parallel beta-helix repeat-containing protein [Fluviibacterium sp. MJW13]